MEERGSLVLEKLPDMNSFWSLSFITPSATALIVIGCHLLVTLAWFHAFSIFYWLFWWLDYIVDSSLSSAEASILRSTIEDIFLLIGGFGIFLGSLEMIIEPGLNSTILRANFFF